MLGTQTIRNAARAEVYGVDIDAEALLTSRLRLSGSVEYLRSKYISFPGAAIAVPLPGGGNSVVVGDASGNELYRAPRWTGNAAVDYSLPVASNVSADFNLTYSYNNGYYPEPDNVLFQNAYSLINTRVALNFDNRHKITFWARNLTNKYYTVILTAATVGTSSSPGEPRTYGVSLETKF